MSTRLYDRNFVCAFLIQVGFALANTALIAHYSRWVAALGGGVNVAGWITGTASVAGLLLRSWIGQWIDRWGARTIWMIGFALFAVGTAWNLWIDELGVAIYLSRALLVVGSAIVFSSALTYVSHLASAKRRAEAIGTLGMAGFLGILLGPLLGELILSSARTRGEFETLFSASLLLLIAPAILLLFLKRPESELRTGSTRPSDFFRACVRYWPGVIVAVQMIFGLCMTVPFVFLTKYVDDTGLENSGFSRVSIFYICYAGWGFTLRLLLRRTPERLGRRKMLLAGSFFMGTGMLSFLLLSPQHSGWIVLPALLCGTGHSLMYHTCTALLLESFPAEARGVGSALSMIAMDAGLIGGSQALGEVAYQFGYNALFIVVSVAVLFAGVVYAVASIPVWSGRLRPLAESP